MLVGRFGNAKPISAEAWARHQAWWQENVESPEAKELGLEELNERLEAATRIDAAWRRPTGRHPEEYWRTEGEAGYVEAFVRFADENLDLVLDEDAEVMKIYADEVTRNSEAPDASMVWGMAITGYLWGLFEVPPLPESGVRRDADELETSIRETAERHGVSEKLAAAFYEAESLEFLLQEHPDEVLRSNAIRQRYGAARSAVVAQRWAGLVEGDAEIEALAPDERARQLDEAREWTARMFDWGFAAAVRRGLYISNPLAAQSFFPNR